MYASANGTWLSGRNTSEPGALRSTRKPTCAVDCMPISAHSSTKAVNAKPKGSHIAATQISAQAKNRRDLFPTKLLMLFARESPIDLLSTIRSTMHTTSCGRHAFGSIRKGSGSTPQSRAPAPDTDSYRENKRPHGSRITRLSRHNKETDHSSLRSNPQRILRAGTPA